MIIDMHVHPGLKPFHSGQPTPDPSKNIFDNLDNPGVTKFLRMVSEKTHMGVIFYSQSNLDRMLKGGIRAVCISLYPVEKGFAKADLTKAPWIETQLLKLFGYNVIHLVEAITGMQHDKVNFIRNTEQDYYPALLEEYNYIIKQTQNADGSVKAKFVKNYNEFKIAIADDKTIALINSIEGAHVFGTGTDDSEKKTEEELKKLLQTRIAEIKTRWEYPPFFISLNHHFWNQLGGHARSLSGMLSQVIDQNTNINKGLTELGRFTIRELLSTANGKRILIDIKHMSAASRKDFYTMLNTEFPGEKIPIICSHTGIMDQRQTLTRIIQEQNDSDTSNDGTYLHNWSINLCKEDIQNIFNSGGLIGIQLDEKRLGGGLAQKKIMDARKQQPGAPSDSTTKWLLREEYLKLLWANILSVVRFINKAEAWDIISIGSDMDGIINPIDIYPDCASMNELADDMRTFLHSKTSIPDLNLLPQFIKKYMFGYTPEEIVHKIMFENADEFFKTEF